MRGSWFDPICTKYKVWGHQLNSRQSDLGMGAHAITCKENTRYQGCSPIPLFDRDFPSVTLVSIIHISSFFPPPGCAWKHGFGTWKLQRVQVGTLSIDNAVYMRWSHIIYGLSGALLLEKPILLSRRPKMGQEEGIEGPIIWASVFSNKKAHSITPLGLNAFLVFNF